MNKATKRVRGGARSSDPPDVSSQEFFERLRDYHDAHRLWRFCRNKRCKRDRCCRGNEDCARRFPTIAEWVRCSLTHDHEGLVALEAKLVAAREVRDSSKAELKA
jgi:hypothetical protein